MFGAIGADQLLTEAARAYVDRAISPSEANGPLYSLDIERSAVPEFAWLDEAQRAEPDNARLTGAIETAKAALHLEVGDNTKLLSLPEALAPLHALKDAADETTQADQTLRDYADGTLSQGCAKIIGQSLVTADTDPSLVGALVTLIEHCATAPAPRLEDATEEQFEHFASWGSPASRVDAAASCLDLCLRRPDLYAGFEPLIDALIIDAHPAVRLQATLHLIRIWDMDREGFWRRAERVVQSERNGAVLDHFLTDVLGRLTGAATAKVAELVVPLLGRFSGDTEAKKSLYLHLTQLVAILWISHEEPAATAIVTCWRRDPVAHVEEVTTALGMLRAAVTAGLQGEDGVDPVRRRAQAFFAEVVSIASDELAGYGKLGVLTDQQTVEATACVRRWVQLIAATHSAKVSAGVL